MIAGPDGAGGGRPRLTVIAGPTGSGKSALAIRSAKQRGAEIVNADSQQVYRHFDIGTAKPSAEQRAEVPHHLISVVDPLEPFSAARFQALADAAISEIAQRSRPILVVGGTGLYIRILLHGVVEAAPADPALRRTLETEAEQSGDEALHQRLREVDPRSAERIHPADRVRTIRALEIHQLTGQTASDWREAHRFSGERYPFSLWVLAPPRQRLYEAIDRRAKEMFEHGLLDEVAHLVERGYGDAPVMRSVGYKEAYAALRKEISVEEAIQRTATESRHYAKRQLTWFRKEPNARFIAPPYAELDG